MTYKALFRIHKCEGGKVERTLNQVENLMRDVGGESLQVAVVFHGDGVHALLKVPGTQARRLAELRGRGVQLLLCGATMRRMNLEAKDLVDGVDSVPTGIGEILRRKSEGWISLP